MHLEITITHRFDLGSFGPMLGLLADGVLKGLKAGMDEQLAALGAAPAAATQPTNEVAPAPAAPVEQKTRTRKPRGSAAAAIPTVEAAPTTMPIPAEQVRQPTGIQSATPGFDTAGFPMPGYNQHGVKVPHFATPAQAAGMTPVASPAPAPAPTPGWSRPTQPAPAQPAAPMQAPSLSSTATLADVQAAFTDLIYSEGGEQKSTQVLARLGVEYADELKPEQYAQAVSEMKAALRS